MIASKADAIAAVGGEGVQRLLFGPTAGLIDRAIERIAAGLDQQAAVEIDNLFTSLAVEASRLGVHLGYALASNPMTDGYEQWLRDGIAAAGLTGYQPEITVDA